MAIAETDTFLAKKSLNNGLYCGDAGIIKEYDNTVFIAIIDVLGHGREADIVAQSCLEFLEKNYRLDLITLITALHEHIKGSRGGAVVGFILLNKKTGKLRYTGIGNITIRVFGFENCRLVLGEGVVGYMMRTPEVKTMQLNKGDALVLYSDGIKEHFELKDYPELIEDDARTIASRILERFDKNTDDALCIALKYC